MYRFLLFGAIFLSGTQDAFLTVPDMELRGLWIATVINMDWPSTPTLNVTQQKEELLFYLELMQETNLNCLFFQVRPVGDALYVSELEPWSVYLTGKQGQAPDPLWDPLQFVVDEAHHRGIQVHAWINPFRVKYGDNTIEGLDDKNMALRYPQYAYPYGDMLWMDPSAQIVNNHTFQVVEDILSRYNVDGLHIDDYFYPYPYDNEHFPDNKTFEEYLSKNGTLSLDDWRRENINTFVSMLSDVVHSHDRIFSISPGGIYRPGEPGGQPPPIEGEDPYSTLYADTKLWLEKGLMDWIVLQIYWQISAPNQSYPLILDWWLDVNQNSSNKLVCAGNAIYKIEPPSNWNTSEIVNQVHISRDDGRRSKGSLGNVHFSASVLKRNSKDIVHVLKGLYPNVAQIPNQSYHVRQPVGLMFVIALYTFTVSVFHQHL